MLSIKFRPQELVVTPGAAMALHESGLDPVFFLHKHICGDWGDLTESDRRLNEESLRTGGRVVSSYRTLLGKRLGVVTPADRSLTVILDFPDEC